MNNAQESAYRDIVRELTSWLRKPIKFDRLPEGKAQVWFNGEYPFELDESTVHIVWPDAVLDEE